MLHIHACSSSSFLVILREHTVFTVSIVAEGHAILYPVYDCLVACSCSLHLSATHIDGGIKSSAIHQSSFIICINYHQSPCVLLQLLGAHAPERREQAYPALLVSRPRIMLLSLVRNYLSSLALDFGVPIPSFQHTRFSLDLLGALGRFAIHVRCLFCFLLLLVSYFGCLMQALHLPPFTSPSPAPCPSGWFRWNHRGLLLTGLWMDWSGCYQGTFLNFYVLCY